MTEEEGQEEQDGASEQKNDLTPAERHQQALDQQRSLSFRVMRFAVENMTLVVGGAAVLVFVYAGILEYPVQRNHRVIGISAGLALMFIGRPVGKKVRSLLFDPRVIWLVDIDARIVEGGIYRMPSQRFVEFEVVEGQVDWVSPDVAFCKNVDLEQRTLQGTWRGTLTDRELLRSLQAVDECRGQLEEDARRGFIVESQAFSIVHRATKNAVMSIVDTFERNSLPDEGVGISDAVESALDEHDVDTMFRRANIDKEPEQDIAEEVFDFPAADDGGLSENGESPDSEVKVDA